MSRTLNLVDHLLSHGRNLQRLGRSHDALRVLHRLAGLQELPPEAAEETQLRLAELALERRKYRRARRHLTAALAYQPDSARYHFLMATAADAEDTGDPRRAARHYRRALQFDPGQPEYLGAYGLLLVREGRTEAGLTCLRRAVELAPADPEAVTRLATGMLMAGRPEGARSALRTAFFRNPRDGRFRRLWQEFEFRQLAQEQETARRRPARRDDDAPMLLPLVARGDRNVTAEAEPRIFRQDGPSTPAAPHAPRPGLLSDQRHAQ